MRLAKCDECGTTGAVGRYEPAPTGWIVLSEGAEDELTFDGWGCLSTWATRYAIEQATTP